MAEAWDQSSWMWNALCRGIKRGYMPPPGQPASTAFFSSEGLIAESEIVSHREATGQWLVFVFPTVVGRGPLQLQRFQRAVTQIEEAAAHVGMTAIIFFAVQWKQVCEQAWAQTTVQNTIRQTSTDKRSLMFGLSLKGLRKADSINAIAAVVAPLNPVGMGWVDDDVVLWRGCLRKLITAFVAQQCRGAVGARKIACRAKPASSRILYDLKNFTQPAMNYPHGCCIVVDYGVVRYGIPSRYASDDGFIFFELVRPSDPVPLRHLIIAQDARCYHRVGSTTLGSNIRRIRRMLLNHLIFIADYPQSKGAWYLRNSLFWGLWPLSPWKGSGNIIADCTRWFLKLAYLAFFMAVGLSLTVRGLVRRPVRLIPW